MADATIKDVLAVLARLEAKVDAKADATALERLSTKTDEGFAAVRKDIAALDRDLDGRMKVHRELEKDIEALKKRPARTAARATRAPRGR